MTSLWFTWCCAINPVIPVDTACENIRNKLNKDNTLRQRSKLSIGDIIKFLRFTLSNSHFNYNNETYKQIHGCTVGSPVSPIVVNLCMKEIEELAFYRTYSLPKIQWWIYSVSENKLPQLILGYIYILKYLQSKFTG